jgi:tRNA A-37 threonylcarbamoyl transferase component Bud32
MTTGPEDLFIKGQRIDRYEIREHVGQGGMGAVYRAVDTKLGRTVALKTVVAHRRGARLTEEIRERFMREALAASRVDHRNVVQVLDFGFAEDSTPYMVMEYLRGRSLSEILKSTKEPLALDYIADVMLSVCAALRACHHVGIIHRDLKPANIFLCDTDTGWEVKVLDFGISKAPAADELTQEGQIIGTPQYLSPEQIEGTVGPESDQYALGVLMYACLTQRLPFAGYESVGLLRAISSGTFDAPRTLRPGLPDGLEAIVMRAMNVVPMARFESIHALGQRLWEFASPRGQAQWKTFYFHAPAAGHGAETATFIGPARQRGEEPARVESTASLDPGSALAKTAALGRPRPTPELLAATKTAAAPGIADATSPSHSDIAGESALSDAPIAGGPHPFRRRMILTVAAVACAAAVLVQRPWRSGRSVTRAPTTTPAPARDAPPVAAPAPTPSPRAAPVAASGAVPAAPPPPSTAASPKAKTSAGISPRSQPRRKHATRHRRPPNIDQQGIGIPND